MNVTPFISYFKLSIMKKILFGASLLLATLSGCSNEKPDFITVNNANGPTLGYSPDSGVQILQIDDLNFKDLNKNGILDPYEDWRLSFEERAKDLASKMSVEQIAGLMLYSGHQTLPSAPLGVDGGGGSYNGKAFNESGADAWELTDQQKKFLQEDNLRHVLLLRVESAETAARWNNEMQAFVEGAGLGIPVNTSSDPRHAGVGQTEFNSGSGNISQWPDGMGLAATFDPEVVRTFGDIASQEYRAMGISTALHPQIDLGTEPRWFRIYMTFGESPELTTDMARAYVDAFQTSTGKDEIAGGWGYKSVNAMVKHWPSGGPEEGGRDGHWAFGKYAVYPGNNFETHLKPFTEGAFKLEGKTGMASAVMPYYTISHNQSSDGTNLGNGFSKYIITDLLREKYGYEGVVCTDWMITHDEGNTPADFNGKPWGVEDKSVAERHYIILMAGVDQFGGNNEAGPVMEAYRFGVREHGEAFMRNRFEQSAVRLLMNIFRLGMFENPYLDPQESAQLVGNPEFMKIGYEAQLKSVVMLKNKDKVLPIAERKTVYIPKMLTPAIKNWWGRWTQTTYSSPVNMELVKKYYNVTNNPDEADFAIVFVNSPYRNIDGGGYDIEDRLAGGNGYIPISLQYGAYTATTARPHSLAAGDPVVDPEITDRSYRDKSVIASNYTDLTTILSTKGQMGDKPVIVVANITRPMIFNEFEKHVDAIITRYSIGEQAVLDIISGKYEPSGLLPVQMPANMKTVETQLEDVPFDMDCHVDSEGSVYDFGFGLNWNGQIKDARTEKYNTNNYSSTKK